MPANNQRPAPPLPASPRNTSKYTNKDGSKFITVPKGTPSDSSQPSTPTTTTTTTRPSNFPPDAEDVAAPAVNRKKQKRRQKAAAKAAAEQAAAAVNGHLPAVSGTRSHPNMSPPPADDDRSDDEADELQAEESRHPTTNGHPTPDSKSKKKKKKKQKNASATDVSETHLTHAASRRPRSPLGARGPGMSRDKIWSTSNHEERERIKEFWLGLGEDERKSLVKVEKDAVLKKMKEQQKHTCSCTVCGRKRTAIEEELEGLYDAYYLELEQFANQGEGPPMLPPPRDFALPPPRRLPAGYAGQPPSRGRIVEHVGDDDDDDDEIEEVYSDEVEEVDDEEFSDDEPPEEYHSAHDRDVADFLTFGNSLQVKGGILTVADDLLKNDGKRFIEMMEQLAERRMAREEDAREHFARGYGHPNGSYSTPHNHPPLEEDEYEEEEDEEEDYDDSQDEEYEDEEDQMTEEQRMEEGRRMFQIFAARMFEQRVLSAYKEKVAKERQQKLLEELEEESRQVNEQKAKKAKNAQKKKDKAAQKKQALAEEKARKEAEKAAEEAARIEAEQRRAAEQRQKAEDKRKQKEAQKKAEEEARLRKEADRQRRLHEQREKQAELERKAREAKEREKKAKEEQRLKDKEAREQREREAQERKDKQERDKREKEARAAKAHKEAQEAREAKERAKEEKAAQKAAAAAAASQLAAAAATSSQAQPQGQAVAQTPQSGKRSSQQHSVPVPTVLPHHPSNPATFASPKIPVATPVIPKAPTPIRPRTTSQQHELSQASSAASQSTSVASQNPSPHPMTPVQSSPGPGPFGQQRKGSEGISGPGLPSSHSVSPPSAQSKMQSQSTPFQMPPIGMQPPPGLAQHPPPGFPNRMSHDPIFPPGFRPPGPGMMMPPPGMNGPGGRGFPPVPIPPPGFAQGGASEQFPIGQGFSLPKDIPPHPTHARQGSTGFDGMGQPIGRPAPIGRPGSIGHSQSQGGFDDDAPHLGSSALLDDDEPFASDLTPSSIRSHQPPGPRVGSFTASPFMDPVFPMGHNPWGPPAGGSQPFPPPGFGANAWGPPGVPPGFSVGSPVAGLGSMRAPAQPRHIAVRLMLCQACKDLAGSSSADADGYIELDTIKSQIDAQAADPSISEHDLLLLCETEGSSSNGGGTFDVKRDVGGPGNHWIRWAPDASDGPSPHYRAVGAPGEIGSPLTGHATVRGI